jgi:hypothetical protein
MKILFLSLCIFTLFADQSDLIEDAYEYGFPLVIMDATKNTSKSPLNQFDYIRKFPDASFTEVVSPNADTLYSSAWLDLSKEPIILSIPEMGDRYFLFPVLDQWTNVIFSPGSRTTGSGKQNYAFTAPKWSGNLPSDVKQVRVPTDFAWIIGRIKTDGPSDYAAVNKLQDGFKLTPLSAWGTDYTPPAAASATKSDTAPIAQVFNMDGAAYFKKLAEILKTTPIPAKDTDYVKAFADIGLVPGQDFNDKLVPASDLNEAVNDAKDEIKQDWNKPDFATLENGWAIALKGLGNYGTDYEERAAVAYGGLGANLPADAVYPAARTDDQGRPLSGENTYLIHFDKSQIPPVNGFWSLTMYNDKQFFVENPLNRYAIGDRNKLKFNEDGSLDLYVQHESPGTDKESNWLPSPKEGFNLILRLYWPKENVLNGEWKPPKIQKTN